MRSTIFRNGVKNHSVPLYHKQFALSGIAVIRVVATDTVQVPAGHATIPLVHIPNWKRSPFHLNVSLRATQKCQTNQDVCFEILFDLSEDVILVVFKNMTFPEQKQHLRSSEILPEDSLNNVSQAPGIESTTCKQKAPLPAKKDTRQNDLQTLIESVGSSIKQRYCRQFTGLVWESASVFSSSEWDLGQCDATSQCNGIYPG